MRANPTILLGSRSFVAESPAPFARLAFYRAWRFAARESDDVSIAALHMAALGLVGGAPGVPSSGDLKAYGRAVYEALAGERSDELTDAAEVAAWSLLAPMLPPSDKKVEEARDFSEAPKASGPESSPPSGPSTTATP